MLTRSDCWDPIERRPFIHLRKPSGPVRSERPGLGNDRILRPVAVDRVIRRIRGSGDA